jgi:hypothetical protein
VPVAYSLFDDASIFLKRIFRRQPAPAEVPVELPAQLVGVEQERIKRAAGE